MFPRSKTLQRFATDRSAAAAIVRRGPATAGRVALAGAALALGLMAGSATGSAADLAGSFRGNAYAASANAAIGPVAVSLGQVAYIPCPCNGTFGKTIANEVDSVRFGVSGSVLKADVARDTIYTTKTSSSALIRDTSTITHVSLLNGLITADALTVQANVSATAGAMTANSDGSSLVNLKVGGTTVDAAIAANSMVELPGIGFVTLFKTKRSGDFTNTGQITVEAVTIDVNHTNALGLPVGAQIVLAHAIAGYARSQPAAVVAGSAYAASANATIGSVLQNKIGQAAAVFIDCAGTNGKTLTNTVASFAADPVLTSGTGNTTAFGGPLNGAIVAKTSAIVENVSLLGGLITARTVSAVVQETFAGGQRSRSFAGSGFDSLTVAGLAVALTVPPNTTIAIPLVGKVVVNEQIVPTDSKRSQVNGLHITITNALNVLHLPVGAEIIVAHADAATLKF